MLRIVIETVVFARRLINPYSRSGQIVFSHNKTYQLFVSEPIVKEILEVLKRPELTSKFHTLKKMDFNKILKILSHAQAVEIPNVPNVSRDPKDNIFIATATQAEANYLVSEDKDLLVLKKYKGVKIINTEQFIEILNKSKQ